MERDLSGRRWILPALLLGAAALRLWGASHDLPFSFYGDELQLVKRSMAMGAGDLNPHFHKPAFLLYLLLAVYGGFYVGGRLAGRFESREEFGAQFLADAGPFLLLGRLLVVAFGVATVWAVYRLALAVYRRRGPALWSGALAATLPAMVASSQHVKEDVPAGCLTVLAVWLYLRARRRPDTSMALAGAGLLAGAAMATKYYAGLLIPAFLITEAMQPSAPGRLGAARRGAALAAFLGVGFFLASPFTLLDMAAVDRGISLQARLERAATPGEELAYEPDRQMVYRPGPRTWVSAGLDAIRGFASQRVAGLLLSGLFALGAVALLRRGRTRPFAILVVGGFTTFLTCAAILFPYHVQGRHFNAVLPLLCPLAPAGALLAVRSIKAARGRRALAVLLLGGAFVMSATLSFADTRQLTRLDSRVMAHRWIVENLPREGRLLLDDYGPPLPAARASVERRLRLLDTLPPGPFTIPQRRALVLQLEHPLSNGFDLDELGHLWWRPEEKTDEELRSSPTDRARGNPVTSRQPRPLAEYRDLGFRFVVTNSDARNRYLNDARMGGAFPSFTQFYRELDTEARLLRTFRPTEWSGKGPTVWIYELDSRTTP